MKKIILPILLCVNSTAFASFVQIMPNNNNNKISTYNLNSIVYRAYGSNKINQMEKTYNNIRIKLINDQNHNPDHLLVFKNKKYTKGFELDKIDLNNNKITQNIKLSAQDSKSLAPNSAPVCPDESIDFVISSYNYSDYQRQIFSSPALDEIRRNAIRSGFKVKTLYDDEATTENIMNYLSCPNVKAYHDTGDGNTDGWETFDGMVSNDDIDNNLNDKLKNKIIYLNDCLVFNDPLKTSIISAGASGYMGGITTLSILTTDEAGACTWSSIFENHKDIPLNQKSEICQDSYDYSPFGFNDGVTGAFQKQGYNLKISTPISELPWGAINEGDLGSGLDGKLFGKVLNITSGNNSIDSKTAFIKANDKCVNNQGQSCDEPYNEIAFKYCASMVYSDKPYFGYSDNIYIAEQQAMTACESSNFGENTCDNIIYSNCNE